MIISRTPFRLSLIGGSTDFPSWYLENGGLVISGAINAYSYISVRRLPSFHEYRSRVVYSKIETVSDNAQLEHGAIREAINFVGLEKEGLEIFHQADLPGRSGTGSSSSFVVGLLNALTALKGERVPPAELAASATYIERNVLGECVGSQDQVAAAYGGFNLIRFHRSGEITVSPLALSQTILKDLETHILLLFTGVSRTSSEIAKTYKFDAKAQFALMKLTEDAISTLYKGDFEKLGGLIDQSWRIKAGLSASVNTPELSRAYATAQVHGAYGGKLTGAGGGGSLLLIADPSKHEEITKILGFTRVPVRMDWDGSVITYHLGGPI